MRYSALLLAMYHICRLWIKCKKYIQQIKKNNYTYIITDVVSYHL